MASLQLQARRQALRRDDGHSRHRPRRRGRRVRRLRRAVGLRQVDAAADDRRAGIGERGRHRDRRQARERDFRAAQRGLAMVFQSYALYPHMTVYQNLAFGLENLRTPRAEIDAKVQDAARMLRLDALLERRPTQLSGGQRQRVAIGRAIVRDPTIFLFDEPLSNLDAELRVQMRAEITGLHERLGTTMIYVTHDQVEAMTMADRIVVLRGGRVEQVGTPLELYNRPANRFVAGFIGSPQMNFLGGRIAQRGAKGASTLLLDAAARGVASATACVSAAQPRHGTARLARHSARAHRTRYRRRRRAAADGDDRAHRAAGRSELSVLFGGQRRAADRARAGAGRPRGRHADHRAPAGRQRTCLRHAARANSRSRDDERCDRSPTPPSRDGSPILFASSSSRAGTAASSCWPTTSSGSCSCAMTRSRSREHGWSHPETSTCRGRAAIGSM